MKKLEPFIRVALFTLCKLVHSHSLKKMRKEEIILIEGKKKKLKHVWKIPSPNS